MSFIVNWRNFVEHSIVALAVVAWAVHGGGGHPSALAATGPSSDQPPTESKAGDVITHSIGMKLALVPPGTFSRGSPFDEPGRHDDETQHQVSLSRGFYIAVTEVTQGQFQQVTGRNPARIKGADLPVVRVSWADAVAFCRKLSQLDGRTYRLPTDAEWEYACRAGATGPFSGAGSADDVAWHMDNSSERPHRVGQLKPNAWGLYDMHGNVMEWCADWYAPAHPPGSANDPIGPAKGKRRTVRGGSWAHYPRACRSAARAGYSPAFQLPQLGFRVVMEPSTVPGSQ